MDIQDYTKIVFGKIQKFEPELVTKIIGYLLLKEFGDREMIRLAFGPDSAIHSLINEAKSAIPAINLSRNPAVSVPIHLVHDLPQQLAPCSPTLSRCLTYRARHVPSWYWDPQFASGWQVKMSNMEFSLSQYSDPTEEGHQLLNQHSDSGNFVGDNLPSNYNQEAHFGAYLTSGTSHSISNLTKFPLKVCHYYYRGYCKHGQNCRFFHGKHVVDSSAQLFLPNSELPTHEDYASLPGSLGILELELTELLKSRGRKPISIAILPSLYAERYGKLLVGDGYLTESQRHGKTGYSLSKLLARLSSSIQVVDRPHGQHSVVLAEDAHRYLEYPNERSDSGNVVVGSHQIYLTFPAESTFTEDDVSNYFKLYGPVQDVRIPDQQKRMFGFVSFLYPETVKLILMKGNPHYICDSRILVKPYREKLRFPERQYNEKLQNLMNHPSHCLGDGSGLYSGSMTRNLVDEHGHIIELQKQLSSLPFGPRHIDRISNYGYFSEVMRHLEDRYRSQVNILNNISAGEEIIPSDNNNNNDKENSTTELSESSFASPSVGDDITTLK